MCGQVQTDQPSLQCHTNKVSQALNPIGEIFRAYGETYINTYKPPLQHIKLIRAMRLCKTPAMGGQLFICRQCGHHHYVYFGCGRGLCAICQSVKREQWLIKMQDKLLKVPYVHLITTLPHQLNSLARAYPKLIYNLMFSTTAKTVKHFADNPKYLGAKTGMISILHTFGSDMKYHIHVHSLLTFGGIKDNQWVYPKDSKKLCKHKDFRDAIRDFFLKVLDGNIEQGTVKISPQQSALIEEVRTKAWSYKVTRPTMSTENIELYLARYINRIAITNSRVKYIKELQKVQILYNDYKNQKQDQPAPKATKYVEPLVFIHQYLQHVPPPYFARVRYYGIHSAILFHKIKAKIPFLLRKHGRTIRTVMEIISQLLKQDKLKCAECNHDLFDIVGLSQDRNYYLQFISRPTCDLIQNQKIRSP